ncbi:PREDICTED: uncharacterized protein LOC105952133 [Erythranthe guttata]|uniref:uncharacterized protein LOC105952133 n=1 Tax=Erythranthe guttata TaxID=4155 RepID=UPI00064DB87B|nr:PREDICTED: uncharacterized protein LOC105952133 [Erythranthe guttata]|eukprot:XP_012831102.1 PREDICTED: uncharacterized protein LOC105952133 [Erythranthe guttata]
MEVPKNPVTIEFHYGGNFMWKPMIKYVGGMVEFLEIEDRATLSYMYFEQLYHSQLGINEGCLIYYRVAGETLDRGLKKLKGDEDVIQMVTAYEGLDVICMYAENVEEEDGRNIDPEDEDIDKAINEVFAEMFPEANEQETNHQEEQQEENQQEEEDDDKASKGLGVQVEEWWSDCGDPMEAEDILNSDAEGEQYEEFNEATGMKNPVLSVGLKFSTPQLFRKAMVRWNVLRGHAITYIKNENKKITAKCKQDCGWRIHASPIGNTSTFQIKSFISEHKCGRVHENGHVNSRFLAEEYLDDLRDNHEIKVKSMKRKVRKDLNVDISRWQVYRAKHKVKKLVEGDIEKQYALLRDYCATVLHHNPGSCFKIQTAEANNRGTQPRFLRLYARLAAQKSGYLAACRPIVGLDGCFLKGSVGGQLLSAVCRDGNDNLFPLAIAVVESECKQTWSWFLLQLLNDMGSVQERGWVFISDRQKGLVETINELMPGVEHRYCIRHMYANFKMKYKGKELKDLFWKAASTANKNEWQYYMNEIKKADPPTVAENGEEGPCAFKWLMNAIPQNWARSHFSPRAKCDILVNNMNESWNNYIIDARDMHVISMLEWIRKALMIRFQVKRNGMLKHVGKLGPNIFKKLEKIKEASANCFPTWSGGMLYEVECHEGPHVRQCSVNLEARSCTCRMWDVSGLPCKHAVSAIYMNKHQPEDYVHPCYTREAYLATYNFQICPVPGEHDYVMTGLPQLLPPIIKKQPGRPKKKRNKTADEQGSRNPSKVSRKKLAVTCAKCLQTGHNKRGCKGQMHPNSKLLKAKNPQPPRVKRASVPIEVPANSEGISQPVPFENSFAQSPAIQVPAALHSSLSSQPPLSQSTFENLFSQTTSSQPTLLHGPNGALFQRSKTAPVGSKKQGKRQVKVGSVDLLLSVEQ